MKIKSCLITLGAGSTPLRTFLKILTNISEEVYIVHSQIDSSELSSFSNIHSYAIGYSSSSLMILRIYYYFILQLKFLKIILSIRRQINIFIFFIGGEGLILPSFFLRILGCRTVLMPGGWAHQVMQSTKDNLRIPFEFLMQLNIRLVDNLLLYSESLYSNQVRFSLSNKVIFVRRHYVDFEKFRKILSISDRDWIVGYIGRLSHEKGIMKLMESFLIAKTLMPTLRLYMIGEGRLRKLVEKTAAQNASSIRYFGSVPHDLVPEYLNKMKILLLPSTSEGLPNIMLEAMACGTPVFANPVGAIPDVITHKITGILLSSNIPKDIAHQLVSIVQNEEKLEQISNNAYEKAHQFFSYEQVLNEWAKLIFRLAQKGTS